MKSYKLITASLWFSALTIGLLGCGQKEDSVIMIGATVGRSILMRMGIYSNQYADLDSLPQNARIAIPNDPTNGSRGLLLLQSAGLISLKEGGGL